VSPAPRGRGLARGLPGSYRELLAALPDTPIASRELAARLGTARGVLAGRLVTLRNRGLAINDGPAGRWRRTPAGADLAHHLRLRPPAATAEHAPPPR
jgi:DNA-binding IclR family transcriptional regulator